MGTQLQGEDVSSVQNPERVEKLPKQNSHLVCPCRTSDDLKLKGIAPLQAAHPDKHPFLAQRAALAA